MLTFLNETDNTPITSTTPVSECTIIEEVGSTGMGAIAISFLIFLVGTIIFIVKAYNSKEQSRYYFLAMYICAFSAMSYLAMLSGEGWIAITGCRQFFYARYAESLITFPLVTVLLGAISGSSADSIASAIGAAVIFVASAFFGTISVVTDIKWLWLLISVLGLAGALVHFSKIFKEAADSKGSDIVQLYGKIALISTYSWAGYLFVWLFSVGFNSFSVSFESCCYAVLDVVAKALVCFIVMSGNDALAGAGAGGDTAGESQQFV